MGSKVRPNPSPPPPAYLCGPAGQRPPAMRKLREFYQQYRQYIGPDLLMYGTFILALALMFVFFG